MNDEKQIEFEGADNCIDPDSILKEKIVQIATSESVDDYTHLALTNKGRIFNLRIVNGNREWQKIDLPNFDE